MLEERRLYLQEHPTKGNGYYTRDLLILFGPLEDLKVPRVREGGFHPKLLPYRRRTSIELSEAILALYASGVSTRDISRFLDGLRDQAGWSALCAVRDTLAKVRKKDRKALAEDLKASGGRTQLSRSTRP